MSSTFNGSLKSTLAPLMTSSHNHLWHNHPKNRHIRITGAATQQPPGMINRYSTLHTAGLCTHFKDMFLKEWFDKIHLENERNKMEMWGDFWLVHIRSTKPRTSMSGNYQERNIFSFGLFKPLTDQSHDNLLWTNKTGILLISVFFNMLKVTNIWSTYNKNIGKPLTLMTHTLL